MKNIKLAGMFFGVLIAFAGQGFCQTNLQFTGINVTPENAIQLHWTSTNHEIYEVDEADTLVDTNTGLTPWNDLYDNYPSHGANTFIGDFGNYDIMPAILHPKYMPTRFYRIVDKGADNDTTDNPSITITAPTNGDVLSGEITVSVVATCSNLPIVTTKLYVDGQEMNESDDGTNYAINTCEWPNGPHIFFAVATARSGLSGPSGSFPISTSHGVSSYMPVTFSNLISRIAFSQPFFEPSLGQTQEVTASFAANCDWTLQIQDVNSNTVCNASGSGTSMTFDWDGTGDGETNIPDGTYTYFISAQTNGMAPQSLISGSSSLSRSPALSGSQAKELYAVAAGSEDVVPFAIYPKGFDTNGLTIFAATPSEVDYLTSSSSAESAVAMDSGSGVSAADAGSSSTASSQSTSAPTRPPTASIKNSVGTYGVAYFDWSSPQDVSIPQNGIPYPATGVCHLDGNSSVTSYHFDPIPEGPNFELNFIRTMSKSGWKIQYDRVDSLLHANDMRRSDQGYGGGELFTTANIGLFMDHGDYGINPDYSAGSSGSKQTYFRCSSDGGDNGWLRMCQIGFGGNLEWMGILACNSLNTYSSMLSAGAIPLKTTHMVCGCSTVANIGEDIGALWAKKMFGGIFTSPETVANAWFDAGKTQYSYATNLTGTINFRVAGYPECMDDTLKNNTAPTSPSSAPGNLTQVTEQVYP
jgi:hypothetical protein